MSDMRRREFITLFGGAAAALPFAARAEQPTLPVVGLINAGAPESAADRMTAFRKGLNEAGYVEGQSVAIEYRWAEGRYDSIPELVADLLRHRVAIIATPGSTDAALAAKAATEAVPIVFADGEDPVKLGLVASLARPGGNVTGVAVPPTELEGKRMRLLRELVPTATSIGVLLNPAKSPWLQRQLHTPLGLGDLPFVVGRGPVAREGLPSLQPDLKLNDTVPFRLSRNHFMIERRDGSYYVRDLRSTLGTIVNGQSIGEHFRGDDAPLRAGENEVIAGGVDSPFVFSVFIG